MPPAPNRGWALQPPPRLPPCIFLDVDGVLHSVQQQGELHFAPACMANLRGIVEMTGAVIVLSSMWQQTASGRAEVNEALRRWGIPAFVAVTADANPGTGDERRAREILSWIRAHPDACATGWVILDDLDLMAVAPPPAFTPILPPGHMVRVNPSTGLTQRDAVYAIEMLGGRNANAPKLPPPQANAAEAFVAVPADGAKAGSKTENTGHDAWRNDARYGGKR